MTAGTTESLVEAFSTRLRLLDVVAWQRIATWAEQSELSFEDLRLLLALVALGGGPVAVHELAGPAGFSLDVAYPAVHRLRRRGHLREEHRRYSLSEQGRRLVAALDAAHREGIQEYVDQLDGDERELLSKAFSEAR
jgi:DNA-binding MarR family transcriptional regulator